MFVIVFTVPLLLLSMVHGTTLGKWYFLSTPVELIHSRSCNNIYQHHIWQCSMQPRRMLCWTPTNTCFKNRVIRQLVSYYALIDTNLLFVVFTVKWRTIQALIYQACRNKVKSEGAQRIVLLVYNNEQTYVHLPTWVHEPNLDTLDWLHSNCCNC